MMRFMFYLLLLPLAGCAANAPARSDPRAFCEYQAANNPEVAKLTMQSLSFPSADNLAPQISLAKRRALDRCLVQSGITPPGGVEPVVPQ